MTFQPISNAGRTENCDASRDRLTLTEVRRGILEQSDLFRPEDLVPAPCHPDSLAMAYAIGTDHAFIPLTGLIPPEVLIEGGRNSIVVGKDEGLRDAIFKLFATNQSPQSQVGSLAELLCCLPQVQAPDGIGYRTCSAC